MINPIFIIHLGVTQIYIFIQNEKQQKMIVNVLQKIVSSLIKRTS